MKKKALALLLTTAMVASLVGCGGNNTATNAPADNAATDDAATDDAADDAATDDAATDDAADDSAEAPAEEEPVTATLLVWDPSEDQDAEQ